MKILCPNCETEIPAEDVDLSTGWARCQACNEVFQVPAIANRVGAPTRAGSAPPVDDGPVDRPADARILMHRHPDKLVIYLPPMGFRWQLLPMMGFAVFWLGFVAFWTAGALGLFSDGVGMANILFACFSIPFWLVGFAMLGGCLWAMVASRLIYLDTSVLITRIKALLFSWRWSISRDQVQTVRLRTPPTPHHEDTASANAVVAPHVVEIVYRGGKLLIACTSEEEQRWVYGEILAFFDAVPFRPGFGTSLPHEELSQFRPLSRDVVFDRHRFAP